jgi:anti-sigma-K factor RskA
MNMTGHYEQDELALFAMQLLSAEEASAVSHHIAQCDDCRRELAAIQGDLAIYAHTVDLHSPSALARERLMQQVAREKKVVPITRTPIAEVPARPAAEYHAPADSSFMRSYSEEPAEVSRGFGSKVLPYAGWAVAAGLAVTATSLYRDRNDLRTMIASEAGKTARLTEEAAAARQVLDIMNDSTATRVTLQKPQSKPVPQGRTTYVAEKGSLLFLASNMEPLLPHKTYELWLIPADGRDPIPAGTFQPDARGNASVILPSLPKGVEAKAFGITIEDESGATTPTMPIIMAGAAT